MNLLITEKYKDLRLDELSTLEAAQLYVHDRRNDVQQVTVP